MKGYNGNFNTGQDDENDGGKSACLGAHVEKWRNDPACRFDAETALISNPHCLVCGCPMLLPVIRHPIPVWKAHCNHCASEVPIVVMVNRKAWREDWRMAKQ